MTAQKREMSVLTLLVWDEVVVLDLAIIHVMNHCSLATVGLAFGDFESRSNIVGLYNLLLRIDRRSNPQNYV